MRALVGTWLPAFLLASSLVVACGGEPPPPAEPRQESPPASIPAITTPEVHHAVCGCTLKDVGRCGNYVELAGRHVKLVWPELGRMEFCDDGKQGAQVEIAGEMKDGSFVATSYRRVE